MGQILLLGSQEERADVTKLEAGAIVVVLRATDRLEARDHWANGPGSLVPIGKEDVGLLRGQRYLTDLVVRPLTVPELITMAKSFVLQIQGAQANGKEKTDSKQPE